MMNIKNGSKDIFRADMLCADEKGTVSVLDLEERQANRFRSLGITEGTDIACLYKRKGISAYLIRGALVGIRDEDARRIVINYKGDETGE